MWLATEFLKYQNPGDVAIKLTPSDKGRLEVYLDGDKIFDRMDEDGVYPNLTRANELKMDIDEKIFQVDEAVANA
jgi:predicted Rdx family selenoprotein